MSTPEIGISANDFVATACTEHREQHILLVVATLLPVGGVAVGKKDVMDMDDYATRERR